MCSQLHVLLAVFLECLIFGTPYLISDKNENKPVRDRSTVCSMYSTVVEQHKRCSAGKTVYGKAPYIS